MKCRHGSQQSSVSPSESEYWKSESGQYASSTATAIGIQPGMIHTDRLVPRAMGASYPAQAFCNRALRIAPKRLISFSFSKASTGVSVSMSICSIISLILSITGSSSWKMFN